MLGIADGRWLYGALIGAALCIGNTVSAGQEAKPTPSFSDTRSVPFNDDWRFNKGDAPAVRSQEKVVGASAGYGAIGVEPLRHVGR